MGHICNEKLGSMSRTSRVPISVLSVDKVDFVLLLFPKYIVSQRNDYKQLKDFIFFPSFDHIAFHLFLKEIKTTISLQMWVKLFSTLKGPVHVHPGLLYFLFIESTDSQTQQ